MRAVLAGAIAVVAVIAALARGASAAAIAPALTPTAPPAPSPVLTLTGVAVGLPGATVTYDYAWPGHTCATTDTVTLVWDDGARTVITNSPIVTALSCEATLTGRVPGNASPGAHFPTASVQIRANSGARASSAFTVVGPPTATPTAAPTATPTPTPSPTPTPTPAPTPTDTPAPTDTPTGAATPTSTTTPRAADVLPLTPTSGGTSGPGGMAVAGVVVVLLVAVAVGANVLLRRRRERLRGQDPFEFLR
jgi:hypothetical protein